MSGFVDFVKVGGPFCLNQPTLTDRSLYLDSPYTCDNLSGPVPRIHIRYHSRLPTFTPALCSVPTPQCYLVTNVFTA
jgi:hypothetical protein